MKKSDKNEEKTNVMRTLDSKKINYQSYSYGNGEPISGVEVAATLNKDESKVFKTLVTESGTKKYYVFLVPVAKELDLKKAAKAVGEKSISMIKSKDLLPLTGYVHGGCSPIGMKKQFPTTLHQTADDFDTILFSAGKIGCQIEIAPSEFKKVINYKLADIIVE